MYPISYVEGCWLRFRPIPHIELLGQLGQSITREPANPNYVVGQGSHSCARHSTWKLTFEFFAIELMSTSALTFEPFLLHSF